MWPINAPAPKPAEPDPNEFKARLTQTSHICPDLHTQLESLIDQVYDSERRERILDRCDQAGRLEDERERARRRKARRDDQGTSRASQG